MIGINSLRLTLAESREGGVGRALFDDAALLWQQRLASRFGSRPLFGDRTVKASTMLREGFERRRQFKALWAM